MRTFPIKVHYKVIEILAVRWLGMKLMQIFKETTISDESWERRRSQVATICFPHELNIVNWLVRSENEARILYTVEKRLYFAV